MILEIFKAVESNGNEPYCRKALVELNPLPRSSIKDNSLALCKCR